MRHLHGLLARKRHLRSLQSHRWVVPIGSKGICGSVPPHRLGFRGFLPPPGDFDQKPYVSSDADSSTVRLQGNEDYVLLACDGFFDAVQPSEVPQLVMGALQELPLPEGESEAQPDGGTGQTVAQKLVAHAKEAGSSDNITVLLVFLRPLPDLGCATGGRCASPQSSAEAAPSRGEAET